MLCPTWAPPAAGSADLNVSDIEADVEHDTAPDLEPDLPNVMRITFADVGQGDGILIQLGETDVVVDVGIDGLRVPNNSAVELLFLTHPHRDHYGGAIQLLQTEQVQRVITNGEQRGTQRGESPLETWEDLVDAIDVAGLDLQWLEVGDVLEPEDGLLLTVLATGSPQGGEFADTSHGGDINNDSLVLRLEYAGRSVLLASDIEVQAQAMLLDRYCDLDCGPLEVDVLKVPHHGSDGFDSEFFDSTAAQWAVISAGYANSQYHHPRAVAIDALVDAGMEIYSTSSDGYDNVVLEIAQDGTMEWTVPQTPVFYWLEVDGQWAGRVLE